MSKILQVAQAWLINIVEDLDDLWPDPDQIFENDQNQIRSGSGSWSK
jgi:hypothetical protein